MTLRMCVQRAALRQLSLAAALVACTLVSPGCSKADETKASAAPAATPAAPAGESAFAAPQPEPQAPPPPPTADAASWTPAALDELLAPVALYPDPVLAQVLAASTNSQEVLDAGNWLLDNQSLKGDALTKAASAAGFSPSVQALVQFPTVLDMMCRELDWTKQLGDAFTADQGAVLAAVQRLRAQAVAVGSLKSSPEMAVEKTEQAGKEVIIVKPADPQIVYVPQYNPTQVYTAPPAATTTTATNSSGLTTTQAVMGGLLAFGAGILVANAFDDDDDHHHGNYYPYPNYGYGGMYYGGRPYYPPPYRPAYPGYRPTPYYRPPANYGNQYNRYGNNNVNVNVNNNNNYYNRFDKNQNRLPSYQARSPVAATGANTSAGYKGQAGQYKGANTPRPTTATPTSGPRAGQQPATRPSASYKGADAAQNRQTTAAARGAQQADYKGAATNAQRPGGGADRGYPKTTGNRPDAPPAVQNHGGGSFSGAGANQGSRERAASERGRSSMKAAPRPSSQRARSGSGSRSASRAR